jgi:hypothetical protein
MDARHAGRSCLAAITMVWKISIHCAMASGSVAILALAYAALVWVTAPAGTGSVR